MPTHRMIDDLDPCRRMNMEPETDSIQWIYIRELKAKVCCAIRSLPSSGVVGAPQLLQTNSFA